MNNETNELKKIKNIYKEVKDEYNLPNFGGLNKLELIEILKDQNSEIINKQLDEIYDERFKMIQEVSNDTTTLEWWNYKYQGERLFSNNNRFFVFLAHEKDFKDGKDLKKDITSIRDSITNKLDHLTLNDIHQIKYIYEKDKKVNGNYTINCISILVTKE